MTTTWQPNPHTAGDDHYECDDLLMDGDRCIGRVEDFGYACYPMAVNVKTGNVERGGAYTDRVEAKLWVERVAGLHPPKPGDERPAFYYGVVPAAGRKL